MTLIVGIRCSDGIVLASDSQATMAAGGLTTSTQMTAVKIRKFGTTGLVACSGAVGMAQIVANALDKAETEGKFTGNGIKTRTDVMRAMSMAIGESMAPIHDQARRMSGVLRDDALLGPIVCTSIVACVAKGTRSLFTFSPTAAPHEVEEHLPCATTGSGEVAGDPFLAHLRKILWAGGSPTVAQARLAATWTIRHCVEAGVHGVGGRVQLATLSSDGTKSVAAIDADPEAEHGPAISGLETRIREAVMGFGGGAAPPPIPKP